MAKQVTRWQPDTCECVIDLEWDTDAPDETREHVARPVTTCARHASDAAMAPTRVLDENRRKNQAVAAILEEIPGLAPTDIAFSVDEHGQIDLQLPTSFEGKASDASAAVTARVGGGVKVR